MVMYNVKILFKYAGKNQDTIVLQNEMKPML